MDKYFKQYAVYGLLLAVGGLTTWLFDVHSRIAVLEFRYQTSHEAMLQMTRAVNSLESASNELKQVSVLLRSQQERNAKDIERLLSTIERNHEQMD